MRRWWWPVLMMFGVACSNGAVAACLGRGGGNTCCSASATITRSAAYAGTVPASDGGVPTQVRLIVSEGNARLTFTRDGVEVVQTFGVQFAP